MYLMLVKPKKVQEKKGWKLGEIAVNELHWLHIQIHIAETGPRFPAAYGYPSVLPLLERGNSRNFYH